MCCISCEEDPLSLELRGYAYACLPGEDTFDVDFDFIGGQAEDGVQKCFASGGWEVCWCFVVGGCVEEMEDPTVTIVDGRQSPRDVGSVDYEHTWLTTLDEVFK